MKLCNIGHNFDYELEKLIRIFLPFEKIEIIHTDSEDINKAICFLRKQEKSFLAFARLFIDGKTAYSEEYISLSISDVEKECERVLAVCLYNCFVEITGYKPQWGILTGVRPAKLFSRLTDSIGSDETEKYFADCLKVNQNKISLCKEAIKGEKTITSLSQPDSFSLYLSVPFCPTRCSYCSFVSHSVDSAKKLIPQYVDYLCEELKQTAEIAKSLRLRLETIYMGGGTPTTLSAEQVDRVLSTINGNFDLSFLREYTVEAGRPDTITVERLEAIKKNGVTRISINPQSLNDNVLEAIGRKHTSSQTIDAFKLARKLGFDNINMDLIAGLPLDTTESFNLTLDKVIELDPESVTVHSLAMKRAANLSIDGLLPDISVGEAATVMVDNARSKLCQNGIYPYYMYRQSKTVGNLENVGYSKPGYEGLYNVYIMDETHTILACGASAVTKLRNPFGSQIERIFNFKYPYEYIYRFEEQSLRKDGIIEFYENYFFRDK